MKKELIAGVIAVIACFSLAACGEKQENVTVNNETNSEVSTQTNENQEANLEPEVNFNNIEMTSDDTKLVFKLSDSVTSVYYYSGDTITGYEAYVDYDSPELANLAKASYDGSDDEIESITVSGSRLIVKYVPSVVEDMTVSELKATYELIQQLQAGELEDNTSEAE